jgi:uncharacterized protein YxeA
MKKTVISFIAIAAIITASPLFFHARGETPSSGDHTKPIRISTTEAKHDSHGAEGEQHAPQSTLKSTCMDKTFVGILASIALMPHHKPHFWHHHRQSITVRGLYFSLRSAFISGYTPGLSIFSRYTCLSSSRL